MSDISLDLLAGHTVIHNHPQGTSFSRQDVRLLLTVKPLAMRVVTARHRYSLIVPPDEEWDDVEDLVRFLYEQVLDEHRHLLVAHVITAEDANLLHWHKVWTAVAEIRGWEYRREEWNV